MTTHPLLSFYKNIKTYQILRFGFRWLLVLFEMGFLCVSLASAVLELALETSLTPNSEIHICLPELGLKVRAFTTTTKREVCGFRYREAKVFEDIPFYFILLVSSVFYSEY